MSKKISSYLSAEKKELKNGITPVEYVFWWLLRAGMVFMILYNKTKQREQTVILIMCLNLLMTFIIPLIRILFFKKIFLGKLPFRIQSCIDVFIFAGSFLGHGLDYNGTIPEYDKFMHFLSGGVTVFIGYLIVCSLKSGTGLTPATKTAAAAGFSCITIMVWEIFEFFSDFFIPGSANQNWMYTPDYDTFLFSILGRGAEKTAQYTVLDTDLDILTASVGMMCCSLILFVLIKRKKAK